MIFHAAQTRRMLGSSLTRNDPSAALDTVCKGPSIPDNVTTAPEMGLPSGAITVPLTTPVLLDCATQTMENIVQTTTDNTKLHQIFETDILLSPRKWQAPAFRHADVSDADAPRRTSKEAHLIGDQIRRGSRRGGMKMLTSSFVPLGNHSSEGS